MLQLRQLYHDTHAELQRLQPFPPAWHSMTELEYVSDNWVQQWLSTRRSVAENRGRFALLYDTMDKIIRTELPEHTDDPGVSSRRKLRIVRGIHSMNALIFTYRRYLEVLKPLIEEVSAKRNRPARLLELASGSGETAMYIVQAAKKKRLPVEVTVSDYIEHVVKDAERRAAQRGLDMQFRTINALHMGNALESGQYDIFLIVGSMHHFKPGQLSVMIAQAKKLSAPGSIFVGIDVFRSLPMLLLLPFLHLMTAVICFPATQLVASLPDNFHDAWLTVRKAHTLYELEQIARIAAPDAAVTTKHAIPGLSVLTVRF